MKIRGNTQILDGSIEFQQLSTSSAYTNDLTVSASSGELARADAIKSYVDQLVDGSLKNPEGYDPTITSNYPLTYGGQSIQAGDSFRITAKQSGIGDGNRDVNIEDLLIAIVDNPSATVSTNWMVADSNRTQATESALGVAKIATQALADAGTDDLTFITPLKLDTYLTNAGIVANIAGAGITDNSGTFDIVSTDLSLTINANDMQVNIGNTNGTSLEVSASGLELASIITGNRTFNNGSFTVDSGSNNISIKTTSGGSAEFESTGTVNVESSASNTNITGQTDLNLRAETGNINLWDDEIINSTVGTAIPLSVTATVDYGNGNGTSSGDVIDQFRTEFTDDSIINAIVELKALVDIASTTASARKIDNSTTLNISNQTATLNTAPSTGFTDVVVYLRGIRQALGTDYTITNSSTGEITFTAAQVLTTGDIVFIDYTDK